MRSGDVPPEERAMTDEPNVEDPDLYPPAAGEPLPRGAQPYTAPEKWDQWILADRGHGPEWATVFRVDATDADLIWRALADAVLDIPISSVRKLSVGVSCEVPTVLTINGRTATVRSIWHYANAESAPRLVTAFPIP